MKGITEFSEPGISVNAPSRVTARPLVALDGAKFVDILAHEVLVRRLKRSAVERLFDISQRVVEISLGGHLAGSAGLRGEQQRLTAAVQLLRLLFIQAGVRHGGGNIVAEAQNGLTPFLRAGLKRKDKERQGECDRTSEGHSP